MPRRELERLLTEWRDAERRRDEAEPGTTEHAVAGSEADRLRLAYQREVELMASGLPSTESESASRPCPEPA